CALRCGVGPALARGRAVRAVLRDRPRPAAAAAGTVRRQGDSMIARGLGWIGLATAALSTLSLYRETMGVPIASLALLTTMLFWITQATSWNVLSGYSGYFSFGQAAYVGVGAYTTAVLFGRHHVDFYLTMVIAAGLCAALALGMGVLAFRLR